MSNIKDKHNKARISLLIAIKKLLAQDNWSDEMLENAEKDAGVEKGYRHILYPEGIAHIVTAFENMLDQEMLDMLSLVDKPKKIRDLIALALETRLMKIAGKNLILKSSGFFVVPSNVLIGSKVAWNTCDLIWKYAGDKSKDMNYYSKRSLLLGVYLSANAFFLADESKDYKETTNFIKNALDNIINIASFKSKLPKMEDIPIFRMFS